MLLPGFDFLFHTLNLIVISINKVSVTSFKFLLRNVLNKATPLNVKALTETLPPQGNPGNFQWCQEKRRMHWHRQLWLPGWLFLQGQISRFLDLTEFHYYQKKKKKN